MSIADGYSTSSVTYEVGGACEYDDGVSVQGDGAYKGCLLGKSEGRGWVDAPLCNCGARYSLNLTLIALDDGKMPSIEKSLTALRRTAVAPALKNMSKVD